MQVAGLVLESQQKKKMEMEKESGTSVLRLCVVEWNEVGGEGEMKPNQGESKHMREETQEIEEGSSRRGRRLLQRNH